jgi:hypothetical protein
LGSYCHRSRGPVEVTAIPGPESDDRVDEPQSWNIATNKHAAPYLPLQVPALIRTPEGRVAHDRDGREAVGQTARVEPAWALYAGLDQSAPGWLLVLDGLTDIASSRAVLSRAGAEALGVVASRRLPAFRSGNFTRTDQVHRHDERHAGSPTKNRQT